MLHTYNQILSPEIVDGDGRKGKMYIGHFIHRPKDLNKPVVLGAKPVSSGHVRIEKEEKEEKPTDKEKYGKDTKSFMRHKKKDEKE